MADDEKGFKLGLALSGGGFRASLFHLGVLAKMAELDLLRHVEVISTVSGGSIVGAAYYLHLRKLLEGVPESELDRDAYIKLVGDLILQFLEGVQTNIRMRTFADFRKNWRMYRTDYARSDRIAELYDETFYRPVFKGDLDKLVELRDIKIRPAGFEGGFSPDKHNPARDHKIPALLLNATVLNNGHAWRFEAARMGENQRSGKSSDAIDKNMRLANPPDYASITEKQQDMGVGHAVAASACVPALFPPLAVSGLYAEGTRLELVDGGVFDNQGIRGLLDRKCGLFVVSDASGQLSDDQIPNTTLVGALLRSNSIGMDRIREEMLFGLFQDHPGRTALIHLCAGLAPQEFPYYLSHNRGLSGPAKLRAYNDGRKTDYGVPQNVQWRLSEIRTDLDSFSDVEAYALMEDAYRISAVELPMIAKKVHGEQWKAPEPAQWSFSAVAPWFEAPTERFLEQLRIGQFPAFKVMLLSPVLGTFFSLLPILAIMLLLAVSGWLFRSWVVPLLMTPIRPIWMLLALLSAGFYALVSFYMPLLAGVFKFVRQIRNPWEMALRGLLRVIPAFGGFIFVWLYQHTVNGLFLREGSISNLRREEEAG